MSQVRVVKVFSETNSSTTNAGTQPTASAAPIPGDRTERKEYHSFAELPPETKKYIDDLLGPDASTKFDNISVVSEQTTRYAQPEVRVVNISHKKVVEENRQIPVMDERTMTTSQQTSTHQHTTHSNPQPSQVKEETKTFTKDMLDQLPEECKKYVNDFMQTQGMQNKNIEHVTVHTTRENTTSNAYQNDIPDLQVKNCLQSHDKIVVEIDAAGFSAEDISMKVSGRNLIIQGRKEGPDPRDPATTLRKELKRDIVMPPGVDAAHISCVLNSQTGRLTVTIPVPEPTGGEYTIPITTV